MEKKIALRTVMQTTDYDLFVMHDQNRVLMDVDRSAKNLVTAISRAYFADGFDVNRMIERIGKKPELIKKCGSVAEYEAMLKAIYNHAVKTERLYLQVEIEKAMRKREIVKKRA